MRTGPVVIAMCLSVGMVGLVGCSESFETPAAPVSGVKTTEIVQGTVHGGRQPVAGARVFVLAAGTGGYGGAGISTGAANQSVSLMKSVTTGSFPTAKDTTVGSPTNGFYYVTSDANGGFGLTGNYNCSAGQQVYLYAVGGQPSPGVTNSAAGFLAVLGDCPAGGTFAGTTSTVTVNEVSTVAAAYALAGFASDALHISSSGTTLAKVGIKNAFANAAQMYDVSGAHGTSALATTPAGNGTVPNTELNALANSLAACVNSSGPASAQCTTSLFFVVKSPYVDATDTATEAIFLAQYPTTAVTTVFNNAAGIGTPFQPSLATAPANWTVGIVYTAPNDISYTNKLAIDAAGNAWLCGFHPGTVSKLSPTGKVLSGTTGYSSGLNGPSDVEIDFKGNAWVPNYYGSSVAILSGVDGSVVGTQTGGGLNFPTNVAFDPSGNAWILNAANTLTKLSSAGAASFGNGYSGGNLNGGEGLGIDASGNIWIPSYNSYSGGSVVEFTNAGAEVGSGYSMGTYEPQGGMALDSSGQVWVGADYYAGNGGSGGSTQYYSEAAHFSTTGSLIFSDVSYPNQPADVAVDGGGQVWVANYGSGGLLEEPSGPLSHITGGMPVPTNSTGTHIALSVAVDGSGDVWVGFGNTAVVTEFLGLAVPVVTPIGANLTSPYSAPASKP